jgi:hypothetical protein
VHLPKSTHVSVAALTDEKWYWLQRK